MLTNCEVGWIEVKEVRVELQTGLVVNSTTIDRLIVDVDFRSAVLDEIRPSGRQNPLEILAPTAFHPPELYQYVVWFWEG